MKLPEGSDFPELPEGLPEVIVDLPSLQAKAEKGLEPVAWMYSTPHNLRKHLSTEEGGGD